ncbi:MAG: SDR family oxidoreductase [Verrucomicrobiota bacterium]
MKKWVLITGGSSGIGLELAKIFAANKYSLVLVARHEDRLQEIAKEFLENGTETKIIAADLSDKNSPAEIFNRLQRENIFVSVLVNNAGFGRQKSFAKTSLPEQLEMIEVNIASLVHLTHLFVQPMLARCEGKILNVASTASFQPGPFMSIYYASKAFVFSFSYALADEVEGTGVTVTALCPGPTDTKFQQRAGRLHSATTMRIWRMTAVDVAQSGYRGLMRGKRVVIPGFLNKLGFIFTKILPTRIPTKVARQIISGGKPMN